MIQSILNFFKRKTCDHDYIETGTEFIGVDIIHGSLTPRHIHVVKFVCTKCGQKAYRQGFFPLIYHDNPKMWTEHFGKPWPVDPNTGEKCFKFTCQEGNEYKGEGIRLSGSTYDKAWQSNWDHIMKGIKQGWEEKEKTT